LNLLLTTGHNLSRRILADFHRKENNEKPMNDTLWKGFVNVPPACPTKWIFLTFNPVVRVRPLTPSWNNLTCATFDYGSV